MRAVVGRCVVMVTSAVTVVTVTCSTPPSVVPRSTARRLPCATSKRKRFAVTFCSRVRTRFPRTEKVLGPKSSPKLSVSASIGPARTLVSLSPIASM